MNSTVVRYCRTQRYGQLYEAPPLLITTSYTSHGRNPDAVVLSVVVSTLFATVNDWIENPIIPGNATPPLYSVMIPHSVDVVDAVPHAIVNVVVVGTLKTLTTDVIFGKFTWSLAPYACMYLPVVRPCGTFVVTVAVVVPVFVALTI